MSHDEEPLSEHHECQREIADLEKRLEEEIESREKLIFNKNVDLARIEAANNETQSQLAEMRSALGWLLSFTATVPKEHQPTEERVKDLLSVHRGKALSESESPRKKTEGDIDKILGGLLEKATGESESAKDLNRYPYLESTDKFPPGTSFEERAAFFDEAIEKKSESAGEDDIHHAKNLLAVIHRDGGHHMADVGFEQACKDAEAMTLADRERWRKALPFLKVLREWVKALGGHPDVKDTKELSDLIGDEEG